MGAGPAQIAETQAALVKARQEEVRSSANSLVGGPGPDVQRWMALKSIAEARSMLQTLFRAAAQQKAQVRCARQLCIVFPSLAPLLLRHCIGQVKTEMTAPVAFMPVAAGPVKAPLESRH